MQITEKQVDDLVHQIFDGEPVSIPKFQYVDEDGWFSRDLTDMAMEIAKRYSFDAYTMAEYEKSEDNQMVMAIQQKVIATHLPDDSDDTLRKHIIRFFDGILADTVYIKSVFSELEPCLACTNEQLRGISHGDYILYAQIAYWSFNKS